jgi:hypothetical protein
MRGSRFTARLRRPDKFELSGGGLMFAPRYPRALEAPGYWDEVYYHDEKLGPVFTFTMIGAGGVPLPMRFRRRSWWPGRSVSFYRTTSRLDVRETRLISPDDRVVSIVSLLNRSSHSQGIDLVVWTAQPHSKQVPRIEVVSASKEGIEFLRTEAGRRAEYTTRWTLGSDRNADSFCVLYGEPAGHNPVWNQTPFATCWSGALPNEAIFEDNSSRGTIWIALHYRVTVPAAAFVDIPVLARITAPGAAAEITGVMASDILKSSSDSWDKFFDGIPEFRCSDPLWRNLYAYRWYLIRHNLKAGGEERQPYDGVCEGSDIFRQPISYSTPPIVFDLRWHRDPEHARRHILNFCERQEENGRLPGALFHDRSRAEFFYHADWGRALERIEEIHPDARFLERVYAALCRYGEWLLRERDREGGGLIDVLNMMETGQEFSSRYIPADRDFDSDEWIETKPMKGVDATVYGLLLWEALSRFAEKLGRSDENRYWLAIAEKTRAAILDRMWLPKERHFSDLVSGENMRPSRIRTLTNFYPFLTRIVDKGHVDSLWGSLLDPQEFWTKVPAATLSRSDPAFSADGVWRGKVRNCPWNGRVWPMTQSHMVEVLAAASELDARLRNYCAAMLNAFARLFCPTGDPKLLSSYEHYHPFNGTPCSYRGVDDYLHCWMVDLIIRYVAGFRPAESEITIDPFPTGVERIDLMGIPYRGGLFDVRIRDGEARIRRDGKSVGRGKPPLTIPI